MKSKLISEGTERTYVLVMDSGDEVVSTITAFAAAHQIGAARISGIGAFSAALLGFFLREERDYKKIEVNEQVEVLSLLGDIALSDNKPKVHLHVVLGKSDASVVGGHLLEASVWPTLEVMLVESPRNLRRSYDEDVKLPLIDL